MLTADKDYIYRNKLLRTFMDGDVSLNTQSKIAEMFRYLPEEEKKGLAQKVLEIMDKAENESDIIGMMKEIL